MTIRFIYEQEVIMFTFLFLKMLNKEASQPKQKADEIVAALQPKDGQVIADIGSGGGYFTFKFAEQVGSKGRIYAVDTQAKKLDFVKRQSQHLGLENIGFVLAEGDDLQLPAGGLDMIFVRNAFHHLSKPAEYFARLIKYLKPEGRVAIIDHKPSAGFSHVSLFKHYTEVEVILQEMERAGYRLQQSFDFLPGQSFNVFVKK